MVVAAGAIALAALLVLVSLLRSGSSGGSGQSAPAVHITKVVVPEGLTRQQIAAIAGRRGLSGSYVASSTSAAGFDPQRYGAPGNVRNLEGFLFPATYELYAGASSAALVSKQLEAFSERFGERQVKAARGLGITPYELLIVASIVEREAGVARDRPLIAAVIYNRLHAGMALGSDATLRYALHGYTGTLSEAQLQNPTPYNTRLHKGLPPTPIANPGMEAIEAAAHPAAVRYLFFIASPDGCGNSLFADRYEEFQRDAAAYARALAANGGHLPACHSG